MISGNSRQFKVDNNKREKKEERIEKEKKREISVFRVYGSLIQACFGRKFYLDKLGWQVLRRLYSATVSRQTSSCEKSIKVVGGRSNDTVSSARRHIGSRVFLFLNLSTKKMEQRRDRDFFNSLAAIEKRDKRGTSCKREWNNHICFSPVTETRFVCNFASNLLTLA